MICGLYIGAGETHDLPSTGTEIPYLSTSINIHVVDLVAEVSLTYKFINKGDLPIRPTYALSIL